MREFAGAVTDKLSTVVHALPGGDVRDLLFVALLFSLTGEVASLLAGETVLAVVFFLSTLFLCGAVWRGGEN